MAAAQSFRWAGWLAVFAAVPFIAALKRSGFLSSWLRIGFFYTLYSVLCLHWVRHTGPWAVWFLVLIVVYALVFMAIPAVCLSLAGRSPLRLAVLPPAWMLMEMLARRTLFQLNWALLGQPLADYPLLSQIASLAGPEALSFFVLAIAVSVYLAVYGGSLKACAAAGGAGIALAVLVLLWGAVRLLPPSPKPVANVAVVQPVNSPRTVWTPGNRGPILARMDALIDEAARLRPDLIALPETAVQGMVRYDRELTDFVRGAVIRTRLPLLFGALDYEDGRISNAAILITPYNTVTTYRKIRLVPFVEYTPRGFPYSAPPVWPRYTPGSEHTWFALQSGLNFAAPICLEDTLPELARDFANKGAQALVALINTRSFLGTNQSIQHLRRARLTAIASGLPIVRAANSGISCSIDSRGRLLAKVEEGVPRAALLPVATASSTLYRAAGDWAGAIIALAAIAAAVAVARR